MRQNATDGPPGASREADSGFHPGQVFLSYASQDKEAAGRICGALRSAGIDVWFDQSELRGGDAWDQSIRARIRDCALFIPIISCHTQERLEGYFRREWKLAVNRTFDMAEEKTFLVPVVIDKTNPQEAVVPEQFRGLQWTVLVDGYVSPSFIARVSQLYSALGEGPRTLGAGSSANHGGGHPIPYAAQQESGPKAKARQGARRLNQVIVAVLFIALAYAAVDKLWLSKHPAIHKTADIAASDGKGPTALQAPANEVQDRSIAVLPFLDMSEKHDQQYFSDGLAEELLNRLAQIPNLRVIARTSSFSFKGKDDDIPTIAKRLNVSNVLEGSVRKSGMHLRVTAQLIRAGTGDHLWSQTYDSEVRDLFAVQDRIAAAVTDALRLKIVVPTVVLRSTKNPEAQSLLMEATYFSQRINEANLIHAADLARRATDLDPGYSDAWARLSVTYGALQIYDSSKGYADKFRDAAEHAIQADPNNSFGHSAMAYVLQGLGDMEGMRREIEAQSRDPRPQARYSNARGNYQLAGGNWQAAIETYKNALIYDPLSPILLVTQADAYIGAQQLEDAQENLRRALFIAPDLDGLHSEMALLYLRQGGAERALAEAQLEHDEDLKAFALIPIYRALGRIKESDALLADEEKRLGAKQPIAIAECYALIGNKDRAIEWLNRAFKQHDPALQAIRGDYYLFSLREVPAFEELLRQIKAPTDLSL